MRLRLCGNRREPEEEPWPSRGLLFMFSPAASPGVSSNLIPSFRTSETPFCFVSVCHIAIEHGAAKWFVSIRDVPFENGTRETTEDDVSILLTPGGIITTKTLKIYKLIESLDSNCTFSRRK